jgi:Mrp family chromosome partitioning ATPase
MNADVAVGWLNGEAPAVEFMPLDRGSTRLCVNGKVSPVIHGMVRDARASLDELTDRLQRQTASAGSMTILLCSCSRGVGCTSLAIAWAAIASEKRSAAILECDWQRPILREMLGLPSGPGWSEAFAGTCPLDEVRTRIDGWPGLAIYALGGDGRPMRGVDMRQLASVVDALKARHDVVIIDGGPARLCAERYAKIADHSILVCDANQCRSDDWARAWDRLEETGGRLAGIIETFA